MNPLLRSLLPVTLLTLVLSPIGAGETPPAAPKAPLDAVQAPAHLGAALAEQRNLSRERPDDAGVWNDLGNLLVLQGDLDGAEGAYTRALEIDPSNANTRFNLALLHQQRGDLDAAVADYRSLLELEPGNAWAQYQLGATYDGQGQRQLAVERYAEAFTLDPELLFAEKNPHIIENHLVTEALLIARRGSRARPPAPRAYDELGRINSILTPPPAPAATTKDLHEEEDEEDAAPSADATSGSAVSAAARREREQSGEIDPPQAPSDRVLSSSDLRASTRNQVQGEAGGDSGAPAAPGTRRRSGANVTPPAGRRSSLHQPPASDNNATFGMGQRSTGALEWRLGPASDEPVPAR